MSNNLDHKFDFGNSDIECIYDFVSALSMIIDSVMLDRECKFYREVCALRNAAWECLPDSFVISLSGETD